MRSPRSATTIPWTVRGGLPGLTWEGKTGGRSRTIANPARPRASTARGRRTPTGQASRRWAVEYGNVRFESVKSVQTYALETATGSARSPVGPGEYPEGNGAEPALAPTSG